jgi:enamine deaminase RidA (YjgF/YER057c/UK114 family)
MDAGLVRMAERVNGPVQRTVHGGGRFETIGSYSRARRVGAHVFVAGTTAIEPSGRLHAPGDTYAQTRFVLDRIAKALAETGASLTDVVRTMAYLTDMATAGEFVRAHGEVFAGIEPVSTAVGAVLTTPGMMVEIEVQAIVADDL